MQSNLSKVNGRGLQPISVLNPPTKLAASLLVGMAAATAVWGFVAPIPVRVNGLGVLSPVDGLFTYEAKSSGRILLPFVKDVKTGKIKFEVPPWSSEAYGFLEDGRSQSADNVERLTDQIINYMDDLQTSRVSTSHYSGGVETGGNYTVFIKKGDIIAFVDNPASRQQLNTSFANLTESVNSYKSLLKLKQRSLSISNSVKQSKQDLIPPLQSLLKKGYASKLELIQAQADSASQESMVTEQESSLEDIELTIQKNQSELRSSLAQYLRDSFVFSFDKAYVQSFVASQWDLVQPGSEILTVSWSQISDPSVVPIFLDQRAATQVSLGDAAVLTPLGFSSAEVGGIKGFVESIEPIPYTTSSLSERLNSQGLAQLVAPTGSVYQVNVKLERKDAAQLRKEAAQVKIPLTGFSSFINQKNNDNSGGYTWNNRSNPPVAPRQGFLLTSQITTRTNTPIQMLIPALKEFSGFAPPNKLIRMELNQP